MKICLLGDILKSCVTENKAKIDRGTHVWLEAFKKGRLARLSSFLIPRKQNASWGLFDGGAKMKRLI